MDRYVQWLKEKEKANLKVDEEEDEEDDEDEEKAEQKAAEEPAAGERLEAHAGQPTAPCRRNPDRAQGLAEPVVGEALGGHARLQPST